MGTWRKYIANHDHEALFTWGGCFHFAKVLHDDFDLPLRALRRDDGILKHVWGSFDGKSVDIHGLNEESYLEDMLRGGDVPTYIVDVNISDCDRELSTRDPQLTADVLNLARMVLRTHRRFGFLRDREKHPEPAHAGGGDTRAR